MKLLSLLCSLSLDSVDTVLPTFAFSKKTSESSFPSFFSFLIPVCLLSVFSIFLCKCISKLFTRQAQVFFFLTSTLEKVSIDLHTHTSFWFWKVSLATHLVCNCFTSDYFKYNLRKHIILKLKSVLFVLCLPWLLYFFVCFSSLHSGQLSQIYILQHWLSFPRELFFIISIENFIPAITFLVSL